MSIIPFNPFIARITPAPDITMEWLENPVQRLFREWQCIIEHPEEAGVNDTNQPVDCLVVFEYNDGTQSEPISAQATIEFNYFTEGKQ